MVYKICIIFWKDLLIRKNHYIMVIFELCLPIGLALLLNLSVTAQGQEAQDDSFSFESFRPTYCVSRHSIYGKVTYEPSTPFINTLMSKAACYAGYKKSNVKPGNLWNSSLFFSIGVKFDSKFVDGNQGTLNYTLFPANKVWIPMTFLWRHSEYTLPRYNSPAVLNVLELQRAIDAAYLELKNVSSKQVTFKNMDIVGRNPDIVLVGVNLCLFVFLSMLPSVVARIVQEKCTGSKELLLMMGLVRWQLWVSKFLEALLFATIIISGIVLFLYVPLKSEFPLLKISPLIMWSVLFYGLIAVICFLFFVSCIFDRPSIAVFVTEIIWILSFLIYGTVSYVIELPAFFRYSLSFLPQISLLESVTILLTANKYGKEIKLLENLTPRDDSPCLLYTLIITTVDILIYLILIWYLEQVNPGKYGLPRQYNFCFKRYYWFPPKALPSYGRRPEPRNENFELLDVDLKPGVSVKSVSKFYGRSDGMKTVALNNVNIDFYTGEISGVLGHNGAGKTTLLSVITGMTRPSEGRVFINGFDLSVDVRQARRSIGLCPQEDMLFNDLTVRETLIFYGMVKGLTATTAKKEALELIEKLRLKNVTRSLASKLSGGQKRKLSLGIALIGGSDVLVLDEPTSGMDTEIRREIWELLLALRQSRTIILSTHFMEEADALCDRIAVMSHGKVRCHGTPMFLKSRFGRGYTIKMVVALIEEVEELKEALRRAIPGNLFPDCLSQEVGTLTLELPREFLESPKGIELLKLLDEKRRQNQIQSFCLNHTTLEDAFLRLPSGDEEVDVDATDSPPYKKLDTTEHKSTVSWLFFRQFIALMDKKWISFLRCHKAFILYTIMPFVILLILIVASEENASERGQIGQPNRLTYSPDLYPSSLVFYSNLQDPQKVELFEGLVRSTGNTVKEVGDITEAVRKIFMDDFYTYARKINFGVDFSSDNLVIYHNDHGVHMVPASLNFIHNFLLKAQYKNDSIVTIVDGRFAKKEVTFLEERNLVAPKCRIVDILGVSGIQTMFYLLGPLREHLNGAKEIQLMTTPTVVYWLSHFVFDFMTFVVYITLLYFGLALLLHDAFMIENAGLTLTGLFLWGSGLILFSYAISTLKKDVAAAFSINIIVYFVFSFVVHSLIGLNFLPKFLLYFHPSSISMSGFSDFCSGASSHFTLHLLYYDLALFVYLLARDSGLLSGLLHSLLSSVVRLDHRQEVREEDVKQEEHLVEKIISERKMSKIPLVAKGLKRWYFRHFRPFFAVRGVSFSLSQGACFGLLGVNGAGKTSTFRMLAGMLPCSQGSIYASSKRLSLFNKRKYLFSVGYCPQSGGLIPEFTGKELLKLIARLRGLDVSRVKDEVEDWLEKLNLLEYAKKKCGTYSGGNKRKLSTAIAMIGDCPLVFLDEPTSGVDPLSRRSIWKTIRHVQRQGRSVVLTSHSMDECEALCSTLAIMVRGRFRCFGEIPTLKERFGLGYCFQLKLSNGATGEQLERLKNRLQTDFGPGCKLVDEHVVSGLETILQYQLTGENINCVDLFHKLSLLKDIGIVESFAASSTSLEQIFIHLARSYN